MYEFEWVCRWDHLDPANQAYFPELVNACHQAGDAFVEELGWSYWDIPTEHGINLPLVETGYEFHRPVRAGDRVTITVEAEMGTSSFRLEFTGTFSGTDDIAFTGFEQHVCVGAETKQTTPLPDAFREDLRAFRERA